MAPWAKLVLAACTLAACCCGKETTRAPAASSAPASPPQLAPEQAFRAFQTAISEDNAEAIWDFLSADSQRWLATGEAAAGIESLRDRSEEDLAPIARHARVPAATLKRMSVPELARLMAVVEARKNRDAIVGARCKGLELARSGATAIVELGRPDGHDDRLVLVKERGTWKLDVAETRRLARRR